MLGRYHFQEASPVKTQCSQLGFGLLGRREIIGGFDGGQISSDGGLMLMRELDEVYGVTARVAGGAS